MKNRYLVYLFYLLLVTLVSTMVSFSRYKTTIIAGDRDVAVARPVLEYVPISATLNGVLLTDLGEGIDVSDVVPGTVLEYVFEIRNYTGAEPSGQQNQVALKYKIHHDLRPDEPHLPLEIEFVPGGDYPDAGEGWTVIGFGAGIEHRHTMKVSWPEEEADLDLISKEQKIILQIDSEQVEQVE